MRISTLLVRGALAVLAAGATLVVAEFGLRFALRDDLAVPVARFGQGSSVPVVRLDAELGFCPVVPGPWCNEYGTEPNDYALERLPDRARVVFLGDSVTRRARIVNALRAAVPDPRIEWWNAGVESFNTQQEVAWYSRHVHVVRPDLVVLTVHPNDVDGTTALFEDDAGHLIRFRAGYEPLVVDKWLYPRSRLYRQLTGMSADDAPHSGSPREMEAALLDLKRQLSATHTELFLFAMPWTKPRATWNAWDVSRFELVRDMVARIGVPWCDGLADLEQATAAGEAVDERPGDSWHPSDAIARRFAERMLAAGVFEPLARREREHALQSAGGAVLQLR